MEFVEHITYKAKLFQNSQIIANYFLTFMANRAGKANDVASNKIIRQNVQF